MLVVMVIFMYHDNSNDDDVGCIVKNSDDNSVWYQHHVCLSHFETNDELLFIVLPTGVMRFLRDVEYMLGHRPHLWPYWVFCWVFAAPVIIAVSYSLRHLQMLLRSPYRP